MPPQKHVLSEREPNEQSKSQKLSEDDTAGKGKAIEKANDEVTNAAETIRQPYEYYCIVRPQFDVEKENEEEHQLDEDELYEKFKESLDSPALYKLSAEHPDHKKWIAMWKSWEMVCEWKRLASYTDPDNFKMYIYNDFNGYGLQELIENRLESFNKEISKKTKDLNAIWALIAALAYWLQTEELGAWMMMDDGKRWSNTTYLIGTAFLEALNTLDQAKKLTPSSPESTYKDIGLVMSLYLNFGLEASNADGTEAVWRKNVIAYAKKAGIDLVEEGCCGMREKLDSYKEKYGDVKALKDAGKGQTNIRWKWKKSYRDFENQYGMGGHRFNILKMSRAERAEHAFDHKDPLADVSDKDLREGNLMFR